MKLIVKALILLIHTAACSDNSLFEAAEKKEVGEKAVLLMEKGHPDRAIDLLRDALIDNPLDYRLHSILSAAIAQKFGLDPIDLALKMAKNKKKELEEGIVPANSIVGLFAVLPDASDENYLGIEDAVSHLTVIPIDQRTRADNFKLSMLHTALLTLRTKKLDKNGDGEVTTEELLDMTETDAAAILSNLIASEESFAAGSATGEGTQAAGDEIGIIRTEIAVQEGDTDLEKLRNFFNQTAVAAE